MFMRSKTDMVFVDVHVRNDIALREIPQNTPIIYA